MRLSLFLAVISLAVAGCSKETPQAKKAPTTEAAEAPAPAAEAPKAEAPAAPAEPRLNAEGKGFKVAVEPPESCTVGSEVTAKVVLTPTDGYKVNGDFPTSLKVSASEGVKLAKAEQKPDDAAKFEEKGATFEVKATCEAAGDKNFAATFKFAVCTETTCDPKREKFAWNVPAQ